MRSLPTSYRPPNALEPPAANIPNMRTEARGTKTPLRPDATHRGTHPGRSRRNRSPSFSDGWTGMPWSIRILRAFLGVTFVFAGVQKFLDPNFLRPGGGDYIGTQLAGFATGTPVAPLMRFLEHAPVLTGIAIALVEIAVGLATLAGIGMLAASLVGFGINVILWLSATWHTHPYFLGSDSIYAVAWLALAAGIVEVELARRGRVAGPIERIDGISRREFARGSLIAGVAVALGLASKALAGPASSTGAGTLPIRRGVRRRVPLRRARRSLRVRPRPPQRHPAACSRPSTRSRWDGPSGSRIRRLGRPSCSGSPTIRSLRTAEHARMKDAWSDTTRAPRSSSVRVMEPSSIRRTRPQRSPARPAPRSSRSRWSWIVRRGT
jgi:uncharacterized membrane protein YphA (DoxX/SURF4 family)